MDVVVVKEHCGHYPGSSSKLFGPPSNVLVYYASGRKFAYFKTSDPEKWRFSIRTTPERLVELIAWSYATAIRRPRTAPVRQRG